MKNNEVASGGLVSLDATKEINETSTGSGLLSLSLDRLSKYDLLHPLFLYRNIYIFARLLFSLCVFGPSLTSDERRVALARVD
jgi:hypothetical protein